MRVSGTLGRSLAAGIIDFHSCMRTVGSNQDGCRHSFIERASDVVSILGRAEIDPPGARSGVNLRNDHRVKIDRCAVKRPMTS